MANVKYLSQPVLEEVGKEVAIAKSFDDFLVIIVVGVEDYYIEPELILCYQM